MSRVFNHGVWIFLLLFSHLAHAALPEAEYKRMLQIAQLKVNRLAALRQAGAENALSTSLVRSVTGRTYQVGDVWDVLACKERSNMNAMTSAPALVVHHCGVFHYEVTEVKPGADAQVKVRVTQRDGFGFKVADPRVSSIELTMSDKFAQSRKTYHFSDLSTLAASPNGVHTSASLLELYPIDVPDIYTAEQSAPAELPTLPPDLQNAGHEAGYSADQIHLEKSAWFEQQDLFGREIQVLWQHGDLWPAYLKTPTGLAILIHS